MSASAAPSLLPTPIDPWRADIEVIPPHASPCRYQTPARWAAIRGSALDVLDRFGAEAARLGWTAAGR
ncbi:hypothetical protein [Methylobacterium trifolii]|uniref:Uncharacterized protein n=1 Tax=Methylobacterium trifolii TaxID=1003092 RepID=A0ABQ4U2S6_9HYPH|nr:hypothetical protein [Methylobacterium trifolii]GJE61765.1 hypothetical protein MPOCJGCO_3891 [Methylobacterium trifolii]